MPLGFLFSIPGGTYLKGTKAWDFWNYLLRPLNL
jgi:hypothetical protein